MITMMAAISTLIISDTGMTPGWGTTDSSNMKRGTITESFTEGGFDFFLPLILKYYGGGVDFSSFCFIILRSPSRKVVLMVVLWFWFWFGGKDCVKKIFRANKQYFIREKGFVAVEK